MKIKIDKRLEEICRWIVASKEEKLEDVLKENTLEAWKWKYQNHQSNYSWNDIFGTKKILKAHFLELDDGIQSPFPPYKDVPNWNGGAIGENYESYLEGKNINLFKNIDPNKDSERYEKILNSIDWEQNYKWRLTYENGIPTKNNQIQLEIIEANLWYPEIKRISENRLNSIKVSSEKHETYATQEEYEDWKKQEKIDRNFSYNLMERYPNADCSREDIDNFTIEWEKKRSKSS